MRDSKTQRGGGKLSHFKENYTGVRVVATLAGDTSRCSEAVPSCTRCVTCTASCVACRARKGSPPKHQLRSLCVTSSKDRPLDLGASDYAVAAWGGTPPDPVGSVVLCGLATTRGGNTWGASIRGSDL
jgi:hypothetical protein